MNSRIPSGALQMQQVAIAPYEAYIQFGVPVADRSDGQPKMRTYRLVPDEAALAIADNPELFDLFRFLICNTIGRKAIVDWETVPEHIRKHFQPLRDDEVGPKKRILRP